MSRHTSKARSTAIGHTDYGPVPSQPTSFATPYEIKGPWPYNPGKAVSMLKSHGWDVKPNGVSTCASPGTGPSNCGAGIKAGAKLEFNLNYASGDTPVSEEMQGLKSDFAKAGIDVNLGSAPFDTIISQSSALHFVLVADVELGRWLALWRKPLPDRRPDLRDRVGLELLQLQQPDG